MSERVKASAYTSHTAVKWQKRKDPQKCSACEADFIKGDYIYRDVALACHARCIGLYYQQEKALGLLPSRIQPTTPPQPHQPGDEVWVRAVVKGEGKDGLEMIIHGVRAWAGRDVFSPQQRRREASVMAAKKRAIRKGMRVKCLVSMNLCNVSPGDVAVVAKVDGDTLLLQGPDYWWPGAFKPYVLYRREYVTPAKKGE